MRKGFRSQTRNRNGVPRYLLQNLAQDIISMMENEEGYPLALEVLDQLPEELQGVLLDNLSSVHEAPLARFFWLVREEYEGEVRRSAQRALEKYRLLGFPIDDWKVAVPQYPEQLYMALASRTRAMGQVTLILAWKQPNGKLDVRYFILKFGTGGIFRYFRVLDLSVAGFWAENNLARGEFVEVSLPEALHLLQEAYSYNRPECGSSAARPVSQYRKWLEQPPGLSEEDIEGLNYRLLEGKLTPVQLVNAYFVAERNGDWGLIYDLSSAKCKIRRMSRSAFIRSKLEEGPRTPVYLHTSINKEVVRRKTAEVVASLVVKDEQDRVVENTFLFQTVKEEQGWKLHKAQRIAERVMAEEDPDNPLNYEVYCALYTVHQSSEVQVFLEELAEVEMLADFPGGIHYRWPQYPNPLEEGINIAGNIFGEFILTGGEMLVVSRDRGNLEAICSLLEDRLGERLITYVRQYYLEVNLVYSILSGEFDSFEELLAELAVEEPEEKLPVVIATYEIENLSPVLRRLRSFTVFEFDTPEGVKVFYEFEQIRSGASGEVGEGFVAEYRITPEFLTVATFGRDNLVVVCKELERGLKHSLRLVDIEEQEEGLHLLAAISRPNIAPEVMARWRQKEIKKWLETEMPALEGMTPRQAKSSLRGRQLLWELFKHMKNLQKDLQRKGINPPIDYREYIRAVGLGDDASLD